MLTDAWFSAWLSLRAGALAPRTVDCYRDLYRLYIGPAFGSCDLSEVSAARITTMLANICASGHTRTAVLVHAVLRRALADAQRCGHVSASPMADVPRPAHRPKPAAWLAPETIPAYVAAASRSPYRVAWLLALCCGLRRGEICGLRWEDIDFKARVIHVRNQRQRLASGQIVDRPPKSAAGIRDIPIPADVLPALRAARSIGGYVVISPRTARPITPNGLDQAHAHLLASAGLDHVRLHDIRHTMGAVAIREAIPIKVLQYLLGHAHYSTTADIYAHVDTDAARAAIDCITHSVL